VGGWTTRELLSILDGLTGLQVVGADVGTRLHNGRFPEDIVSLTSEGEVAPTYGSAGESTVPAAAEVVHSLIRLMVAQPA
jgi:agmatinase